MTVVEDFVAAITFLATSSMVPPPSPPASPPNDQFEIRAGNGGIDTGHGEGRTDVNTLYAHGYEGTPLP